MLTWKLDELQKFKNRPLEINETLDLKDQLQKRDDRVLDAKPTTLKGHLFFDKGLWYTDFDIETTITVPSTRSLEPVDIKIKEHVTEAYPEDPTAELEIDDQEIIMELEEEGINLEQATADNVLLSIPERVLTDEEKESDSMPEGQDWQVISEDEYIEEVEKPKPNPEFAKLKGLFKEDKD
ncbi:YceD family protein [Lactobacillus sp. YT155]|uniref:DUF177 domain-containing protein n=1 Tax=Lactobacillus sp. YT155 TaxID=3060955 RepID=UPI0026603186|nr:YceD family protein [Lactobacillus sp. YT155]MDO1605597.1 YceD family protein [Lactobacillus sp. YT155]